MTQVPRAVLAAFRQTMQLRLITEHAPALDRTRKCRHSGPPRGSHTSRLALMESIMTDVASATAVLLKRDAEFAAAASGGHDVEDIISYWSTDAVVAPPGQPPIVGRDALRKYVQDSFQIPGFNITWEATADPQFSEDLSMAYMWARNQVSFDGADGKRVVMHGRAVTIWRHESDGQWRCTADMWNDEPPV